MEVSLPTKITNILPHENYPLYGNSMFSRYVISPLISIPLAIMDMDTNLFIFVLTRYPSPFRGDSPCAPPPFQPSTTPPWMCPSPTATPPCPAPTQTLHWRATTTPPLDHQVSPVTVCVCKSFTLYYIASYLQSYSCNNLALLVCVSSVDLHLRSDTTLLTLLMSRAV